MQFVSLSNHPRPLDRILRPHRLLLSDDVSVRPSTFEIVVLPGDGIGVDVTAAAVEILQAVQSSFAETRLRFTEHSAGGSRVHSQRQRVAGSRV